MLILYVIFFGIWFKFNLKKRGFNVSSFIILIYLLSAICGVILLYNYNYYSEDRIYFSAICTHLLLLTLFLSPIIAIGNRKVKIPNIKYKYLKIIVYIILLFCFSSIISSIDTIKTVFSFQDLSEARKLYNERELEISAGPLAYLGGLGTHLAFYAIFFAFYLLVKYPKKKIIIVLLFVASFSNVFVNLGALGRDGLIRWLLFLTFNFLFFKDYLSNDFKRKFYKILSIPISIILIVFFIITFARFGDRNNSVLFYLLEYLGQQNIYFSYNFYTFFDGAAGGHINFGYFLGSQVSLNNLNERFYADYHLNTFPTFVGSFYFDMGFYKTLIFGISFFIFSKIFFFKKKLEFWKLIIYLIFSEIIMLGVFYYMFYAPTRINVLMLLVLISIIITYLNKFDNATKNSFHSQDQLK